MILRRALAALPALALPGLAQAQQSREAWAPSRPMRLIIPFPPGGTTDLVGRMVAERLAARLGQPVVVENRPGAGGNLGGEAAMRAEPDGHTLFFTTIGTGAMNFAVHGARMPWRPEEVAAVGLVTRMPNVLMVSSGFPARDMAGFLQAARGREISYGTAGFGSSPHVCMELLAQMTGLRFTHIPFRGSGPMLTELMAGRLDCGMDNIPSALAFIRENRITGIAMTGARRSTVLPEVPVVAETLPGFEATAWFGVQAGARNPQAAIARIGAELDEITRDPGFRARLAEFGAEGPDLTPEGGTTPAAFAAFTAAEIRKWGEVIGKAGIRAE
ncbi:Bug family tripartite tricarboxylate transporter substrate binding protein [Sabulicella rubraurantiaca]|uniref:Bug family tripartite tricarboxylate transporter substrate binding protein n=1 Tax=Sabulicella rubraurantiaca TaxID=2811429 RepID=UPI001A965787|nr:tripartite tricarboxylate transporter substrate-binding protein [Sabulicella rubraurantiaca]